MSINTGVLDQFRAGTVTSPAARQKAKTKPAWGPPKVIDLAADRILAVDQSLGATGLVGLRCASGVLVVFCAHTLKGEAPPQAKGWEKMLCEADHLETQLCDVLGALEPGLTVVHEAPPVGGGKLMRPESSALAAKALRTAARLVGYEVAPMVASQSHKYALTGSRGITKAELRPVLNEWAGQNNVQNYGVITNEHLRDAFCIGVTHLIREANQ